MARNTSFDLVNTKINDKFSTYFSGFILGIFTIILYTRPFQMYVIFYFLFFFLPQIQTNLKQVKLLHLTVGRKRHLDDSSNQPGTRLSNDCYE